MPRLIILLLALVSLALLAVQNLATSVSLVVLSNTLPSIPLGILLVSTVGVGALLTLFLYGLIGIRRPPESKYRPMGRRVPYPEGPGTTLPSTEPNNYPASSPSSYAGTSGSSSAFVSDPAPSSTPSPSTPSPSTNPQDTPPTDSFSASSAPTDSYRSSSVDSSARYDGASSSSSRFKGDSGDSRVASATAGASRFVQQPIAGIKSVFGKKKDRSNRREDPLRPVGDNWGERRTTEHKNTWELDDSTSKAEEGIKGLVNFGRNVGTNAGRLAEDIATGWGNQQADSDQSGRSADVEGYGSEHYYSDDSYYSGNRSDDYDAAPSDDLDRGWENVDRYDQSPRREIASGNAEPQKRAYGDSLYGDRPYAEGDDYEGPYEESSYEEGPYEDDAYEEGPEDGVYEADYRVIVPPSKPLDDE